jgi:predicted acyltransferase
MKRINSIDILRGIAILQMIFWQIFDFFAKINIYSQAPYYIPLFNMSINWIGIGMFSFISGTAAYISVKKRLDKNIENSKIILRAVKRYGGYILISLFFTTFVFGFKIFYGWDEAIQGIGLAALFAVLLILLFKSRWIFAGIGLIILFIQPFLRSVLENNYISQIYPYELISFAPLINIISIILNFTIRGTFALSHLLPFAMFGAVLSMFIFKLKKNQLIKITLSAGAIIILISLALHFSFNHINGYNKSPSYLLFFIGLFFFIFGLIEYLLIKIGKNRIFDVLIVFGKAAIIAYLFHFLFIFKPLEILNIESTFGSLISYIFSIIFIIIIYYICKIWLLKKSLIINKIKK